MKKVKIFEKNHNSKIDEKFYQLELSNRKNVDCSINLAYDLVYLF
jgi:hypothetical protein